MALSGLMTGTQFSTVLATVKVSKLCPPNSIIIGTFDRELCKSVKTQYMKCTSRHGVDVSNLIIFSLSFCGNMASKIILLQG